MTLHTATKAGLKVLVAEDNIINQRIVVRMLSELGHTGVVVADGEKALRCLLQLSFDVVLLDVMMPVMDGLQALAQIRLQEQTSGRHIPVIMATAHIEASDEISFRAAGADGYLAKPLDIDLLRAELHRVVTRR